MLPTMENNSVLSRIYQSIELAESDTSDANSDSLVVDERAGASRASLVESKLATLRQQAASFLRRSRNTLEMN